MSIARNILNKVTTGGEIYKIENVEGGVKVSFYDHNSDAYNGFKKYFTYETDVDASELQDLIGKGPISCNADMYCLNYGIQEWISCYETFLKRLYLTHNDEFEVIFDMGENKTSYFGKVKIYNDRIMIGNKLISFYDLDNVNTISIKLPKLDSGYYEYIEVIVGRTFNDELNKNVR